MYQTFCAFKVLMIRIRFPHSGMVTLIAGPSKTRLKAHIVLLSYSSSFFNAAFYSSFKEAEQNEIELPEEDEKDLAAFVHWTFTGDVLTSHEDMRKIKYPDVIIPVRLWILGDRLLAPKFCNDSPHVLCHAIDGPSATVVEYVYSNTAANSLLRKCIAARVKADGPIIVGKDEKYPE